MIKFTLAASNPPYQANSHLQIYPLFYINAMEVADMVSMIFPSNWQAPVKKSSNGLDWMNNERIKNDKQIVFIDNRKDVFDGIAGAAETNIVLWKKSYDQPRQHIKKQRHYFANKSPSSQGYGFSSGHVWM